MGEPRMRRTEGWKKNRKRVLVLCLCFAALASGWEEGDGSVNVISVENLDALLGLRMVTELNLRNLTAGTEGRARRSPSPAGDLCRRPECECKKNHVSCSFRSEEVLELGRGFLSSHLRHLIISNLTELRILPGAFLDNPHLRSVHLSDISNVTVGKNVFQTHGNNPFGVDIKNCNELTLHDHSFSGVRGPLHATIENCDSVSMKKSIFSPRLEFRMNNVPNLEIDSNTFYVERKRNTENSASTISFRSVTVKKVPSWSFRMNDARISFVECNIGTIDREAFRALQLDGVYFRLTSLRRLETEAFSGQMGIKDVEMTEVDVQYVAGQALSVATHLIIRNSSINEISDGAFNISTAFLRLTGNKFRKIGRRAFTVQSWNSIVISGNEFESLKQDTFLTPFSKVDNVTNEFVFCDNVINATEVDALSFAPNEKGLEIVIGNNTFQVHCHCHLESWMLTLSRDMWESFYDTSNCKIGEFGSCYHLSGGYMQMKNYTAVVCASPIGLDCEVKGLVTSDATTELDLKDTERTIIGVIFLGVITSLAIMLFILTISWMKQKGLCGELRRYLAPSRLCCFAISNLFNDSDVVASSSISRINIHEYAEVQYQMTDPQKQTILAMDVEDNVVACDDKATQTLPEELTQELLRNLKEKLDDPENYNEARNMIEHLYDLIKVEESCNNNNVSRTSLLLDDDDVDVDEDDGGNIYDVIGKKPRRKQTKVRKLLESNARSVGTRAPSPDKLSPVSFNPSRTTLITEYAEPRDRKSNEYSELPGSRDSIMPDVLAQSALHLYATPYTRGGMENRPLPCKPSDPDVT